MKLFQAVVLASVAVGCQTHADSCESTRGITDSQRTWQARHLEDYRFVWQQRCYCLPEAVQPIDVTVRHGEIVSAVGADGSAVSDEVRKNIMTIDALYAYVGEAQCTAEQVRVTGLHDGVPDRVYVDRSRSVADDEFDVAISGFEPLAP
jgi:hypothetical protein